MAFFSAVRIWHPDRLPPKPHSLGDLPTMDFSATPIPRSDLWGFFAAAFHVQPPDRQFPWCVHEYAWGVSKEELCSDLDQPDQSALLAPPFHRVLQGLVAAYHQTPLLGKNHTWFGCKTGCVSGETRWLMSPTS